MTTEVSRCFWCNKLGEGGCVKNGITFCWNSIICPFEVCGEIFKKMDTMINVLFVWKQKKH